MRRDIQIDEDKTPGIEVLNIYCWKLNKENPSQLQKILVPSRIKSFKTLQYLNEKSYKTLPEAQKEHPRESMIGFREPGMDDLIAFGSNLFASKSFRHTYSLTKIAKQLYKLHEINNDYIHYSKENLQQ